MRDLFRQAPLREYSDYSASHLHAANAYQARFHERPGRAAMWELERPLIKEIFVGLAPKRVLDFATGTGRIATELEQCLPDSKIDGIDISEDMLAMARTRCSRVAFHALDGRQALRAFGPATFDVVSAFRFFPNADPALREDVAGQIAELLRPGGHVIVNNHRNFWSPSYIAMRAAGSRAGRYGSRNVEIRSLFLRRGFTCVRKYSLGIWPQTDYRSMLLPWPITGAIERFNLHHLSCVHSVGYNTIFIFRKAHR